MDEIKESIGRERQRNHIIKRYVKKSPCLAVYMCIFRPESRPLAERHCRLASETGIGANPSKQTNA